MAATQTDVLKLMSTLGLRVDWKKVGPDRLAYLIEHADVLAVRFQEFLMRGGKIGVEKPIQFHFDEMPGVSKVHPLCAHDLPKSRPVSLCFQKQKDLKAFLRKHVVFVTCDDLGLPRSASIAEMRDHLKQDPQYEALNATFLDLCYDHQFLFPASWRGKWIYFIGSTFKRNGDGEEFVRYMCQNSDGVWEVRLHWFGNPLDSDHLPQKQRAYVIAVLKRPTPSGT